MECYKMKGYINTFLCCSQRQKKTSIICVEILSKFDNLIFLCVLYNYKLTVSEFLGNLKTSAWTYIPFCHR